MGEYQEAKEVHNKIKGDMGIEEKICMIGGTREGKKGWKGEKRGTIKVLRGEKAVNNVWKGLSEGLLVLFLEGLLEEEYHHLPGRSI